MTDDGYRLSFGDNENVLKLTRVMDAQLCKYIKKITELHTAYG